MNERISGEYRIDSTDAMNTRLKLFIFHLIAVIPAPVIMARVEVLVVHRREVFRRW